MRVFQYLLLVSLFFISASTAATAQTSVRMNSGDGHMTWINSTDNERFEVETEGEVEFRDDDSGIARISQGGFLKASYKDLHLKWKLDVRPASNGTLSYEYEVNGKKMTYSASSEAELAPYFLQILRETGINAAVRVARILNSEGPAGVFHEIEQIHSGSSKVRYLTQLVKQGNLSESDLIKTAQLAQTEVKSSGDLSRFLIATNSQFISKPGARSAYFATAQSIPSSGDKSRVMMALFDLNLDSATYEQVIEVASSISSSGDKTRVLLAGLGAFPANERARKLYFKAVQSIPSSGDQARLLGALLSSYELNDETAAMAFEVASNMSSSGDKSRVLIQAAPKYNNSSAHRARFFDAVNSISSSGDHARVLLALLSESNPDGATIESILDSASHISSSGDASRVLIATAAFVEDGQVDAYLRAANKVRSDGDRGRALKALMDK